MHAVWCDVTSPAVIASRDRARASSASSDVAQNTADNERVEAGAAIFASQVTGLQTQLADLAPTVSAGLDEAIAGLEAFAGSTIDFNVDINETIHYYEAWLAFLAIVVWHFYYVIFNPDVYPMNFAWITGKLSRSEMEHEHPLELERLERPEGEA